MIIVLKADTEPSAPEVRRLIDAFVEAVKEHVRDEEIRERIRRTILEALPSEEDGGAGDSGDEVTH